MSLSYLALGDSYTIGEGVLLTQNFAYQFVHMLRQTYGNNIINAPEIIAKTGWTTDELSAAIDAYIFLPKYDIVSLLIGVNNQYRGREVENFKTEFELLVNKAIGFAGGKKENIFILSIPDWSVTPFAKDRDTNKIASEVDAYNNVCKSCAAKFEITYLDITTAQKSNGSLVDFLATDDLHPSAKEYGSWALQLKDAVTQNLKLHI